MLIVKGLSITLRSQSKEQVRARTVGDTATGKIRARNSVQSHC
jgi:hypothetical protein